jgi:hypothetical protein
MDPNNTPQEFWFDAPPPFGYEEFKRQFHENAGTTRRCSGRLPEEP